MFTVSISSDPESEEEESESEGEENIFSEPAQEQILVKKKKGKRKIPFKPTSHINTEDRIMAGYEGPFRMTNSVESDQILLFDISDSYISNSWFR